MGVVSISQRGRLAAFILRRRWVVNCELCGWKRAFEAGAYALAAAYHHACALWGCRFCGIEPRWSSGEYDIHLQVAHPFVRNDATSPPNPKED